MKYKIKKQFLAWSLGIFLSALALYGVYVNITDIKKAPPAVKSSPKPTATVQVVKDSRYYGRIVNKIIDRCRCSCDNGFNEDKFKKLVKEQIQDPTITIQLTNILEKNQYLWRVDINSTDTTDRGVSITWMAQ